MDYHGLRYLTTRDFLSRFRELNLGFGSDSELEFYEKNRLLLPVARTIAPVEAVLADHHR